MLRRTRIWLIVTVVVLAIGGVVAFQIHKKKHAGTEVRLEQVSRRDLVASVTASGKIEAKTSVDISADITGRIIDIAVRRGRSGEARPVPAADRPGTVSGRGGAGPGCGVLDRGHPAADPGEPGPGAAGLGSGHGN